VLSEQRADILYRAGVPGIQEQIYFLFEHKSYPDPSTHRQILRYMNKLWEELEMQSGSRQKLPAVVSFIVYHGSKPWNISNSIMSSFAVIEGTESFIPDFKSVVIDLSLDENSGDANMDLSLF
jgi:hypothetical protein